MREMGKALNDEETDVRKTEYNEGHVGKKQGVKKQERMDKEWQRECY